MFKSLFEIVKEPGWEAILTSPPYNLRLSRDGEYIIMVYDIPNGTDLRYLASREARGIIFKETENMKPVCVPFFKFGNPGEYYVHDIDWKSNRVFEKADGSLMKVWYDNEWKVSTNGTIDASKAEVKMDNYIQTEGKFKTFRDLFDEAAENSNFKFSNLNPDNTYMFEVTSPYNKIVTNYEETKLYHIGTRSNITFLELEEDIGVEKPKSFIIRGPFKKLRLKWKANRLPKDHEGFVVVDQYYERLKIKSKNYLKLHKLKGSSSLSFNTIVEMIKDGDFEEFVIYMPEYKKTFDKIINGFKSYEIKLNETWKEVKSLNFTSKKDLAKYVMNFDDVTLRAFIFSKYDGRGTSANSYIKSFTKDKLKLMINDFLKGSELDGK